MTAAQFRDRLLLWVRQLQERYRLLTLEVASDVAECLVRGNPEYGIPGTPVDRGFARGSWYAGLNGGGDGTPSLNPSGDTSGLVGALSELQFGDTIRFANNAPYINRLEFDGWSQQASQGWVRLTAAAFPRLVLAARQRTGT